MNTDRSGTMTDLIDHFETIFIWFAQFSIVGFHQSSEVRCGCIILVVIDRKQFIWTKKCVFEEMSYFGKTFDCRTTSIGSLLKEEEKRWIFCRASDPFLPIVWEYRSNCQRDLTDRKHWPRTMGHLRVNHLSRCTSVRLVLIWNKHSPLLQPIHGCFLACLLVKAKVLCQCLQ